MARDCPDTLLPGPLGGEDEQKGDEKSGVTATGLGLGQPAPHSTCHKCPVVPVVPAKSINPFPVLRSSGRNPARQHRLREGDLARGGGKLVGMKDLTQHTQRQR